MAIQLFGVFFVLVAAGFGLGWWLRGRVALKKGIDSEVDRWRKVVSLGRKMSRENGADGIH